jgi:hypothetical protein
MGGARHYTAQSGINPNHPFPGTGWANWWRDAYAARQWLDDFAIGIDTGEGITETTFDFEADAPGPPMVLTTKAARDRETCGVGSIMTRDAARGYVRYHEYSARYYTFVLVGKVCATDDLGYFGPGTKSFYIDDGYKKTEVFCPGYADYLGIVPGQWVRASGLLQIDYGQFLSTDTSNEFTAGDPEPSLTWDPVYEPNIHPRLLCGLGDIIVLHDIDQ